jgi:pilus assembly protein CpaF
MSLLRRMERARPGADAPGAGTTPPVAPPVARSAAKAPARESLRAIKVRLQNEVMSRLGSRLDLSDEAALRKRIEEIFNRVITGESIALTRAERVRLLEDVIDELVGLGPIEPLLRDESITEIMVNGPRQIYIERAGRLERVDVVFQSEEQVMRIIDRIIAPIGRRIDESSPTVDARLADGSRVNAIIAPLSLVGPVITIRKFATNPFTVDDLVRFGTATPEMFGFLRACVEARLNIFVSGGTGSGKTTTLNVLSSFIPDDQRIITIEDAAELQLRQRHVITLEARPPNVEGRGAITIRDLLRNALHMRPDRIIVGECRAGEALDMLQAMVTGQDGSLSTGHSNTPLDMLHRLETMVLMTCYELPLRAIREQMAAAVDLIVHTARLKDGSRKITAISEVQGMEDDQIVLQDLFAWEQTGVTDGRVEGALKPTGARPQLTQKFVANGVEIPSAIFGALDLKDGGLADGHKPEGPRVIPGYPRAVKAGGMVYLTGMGPVDPKTGEPIAGTIQEQARQVLQNLKARLEAKGSSLDKVVWASWSVRENDDLDGLVEEWQRWFAEDSPARQGTLMPLPGRLAAFPISVSVIAELRY